MTEVLGEWHTTSWESCEPEKVFQAVDDSASRVITPTVGLQRRTLTCISANASVLPSRYVISGLYLFIVVLESVSKVQDPVWPKMRRKPFNRLSAHYSNLQVAYFQMAFPPFEIDDDGRLFSALDIWLKSL